MTDSERRDRAPDGFQWQAGDNFEYETYYHTVEDRGSKIDVCLKKDAFLVRDGVRSYLYSWTHRGTCKKFLCLGGPLDGMMQGELGHNMEDYVGFNNASGRDRKPKKVWIFKDLLEVGKPVAELDI